MKKWILVLLMVLPFLAWFLAPFVVGSRLKSALGQNGRFEVELNGVELGINPALALTEITLKNSQTRNLFLQITNFTASVNTGSLTSDVRIVEKISLSRLLIHPAEKPEKMTQANWVSGEPSLKTEKSSASILIRELVVEELKVVFSQDNGVATVDLGEFRLRNLLVSRENRSEMVRRILSEITEQALRQIADRKAEILVNVAVDKARTELEKGLGRLKEVLDSDNLKERSQALKDRFKGWLN